MDVLKTMSTLVAPIPNINIYFFSRNFAELKHKIRVHQVQLKSIILRSALDHIKEERGKMPLHMIMLMAIISFNTLWNVPQIRIWWDIENQPLAKGASLIDLKNRIICSLKSTGVLHLEDLP